MIGSAGFHGCREPIVTCLKYDGSMGCGITAGMVGCFSAMTRVGVSLPRHGRFRTGQEYELPVVPNMPILLGIDSNSMSEMAGVLQNEDDDDVEGGRSAQNRCRDAYTLEAALRSAVRGAQGLDMQVATIPAESAHSASSAFSFVHHHPLRCPRSRRPTLAAAATSPRTASRRSPCRNRGRGPAESRSRVRSVAGKCGAVAVTTAVPCATLLPVLEAHPHPFCSLKLRCDRKVSLQDMLCTLLGSHYGIVGPLRDMCEEGMFCYLP